MVRISSKAEYSEKLVDISQFAEYNHSSGKISLRIPQFVLQNPVFTDESREELKSNFGAKYADDMLDAAYAAIQKIAMQQWIAEILLAD